MSVYPNPATDRLYLAAKGLVAGEASAQIMDVQGRQVITKNNLLFSGANLYCLDVSQLNPGVYFVQVQTPKGREVIRWVKGN